MQLKLRLTLLIRILDDCKLPEIMNIKVYNEITPK